MSEGTPQGKSVGCQTVDIEEFSSLSNLSRTERCEAADLDSTLRSQLTEASECPTQLMQALHELRGLHAQIRGHSQRLAAWDEALRRREEAVDRVMLETDRRIAQEVERRFARGREQQKAEMRLLETQLREKTVENQRLLANFANLRESFEKVKGERTKLQEKCTTLERKTVGLEGRVRNLQKLPDRAGRSERQPERDGNQQEAESGADQQLPRKTSTSEERRLPVDILKGPVAIALQELLSWLNTRLLRPLIVSEEDGTEALDCCLRILPRASDLLQLHLSKITGLQVDRKLHFECLLLLHFAFMLLDTHEPGRKRKVASTLNRLGEAFHSQLVQNLKRPEMRRMSDAERAVTSCFVLHTVTRADILAQTWAQLRTAVALPGVRAEFCRLLGLRFALQVLHSREPQVLQQQLPRSLDLLLCLSVPSEAEEARELREAMAGASFLRNFTEILTAEAAPTNVKEKLVILLQLLLKRPLSDVTFRSLSDLGVVRALQKELSHLRAGPKDEVSSFEIVLETTLALVTSDC